MIELIAAAVSGAVVGVVLAGSTGAHCRFGGPRLPANAWTSIKPRSPP